MIKEGNIGRLCFCYVIRVIIVAPLRFLF